MTHRPIPGCAGANGLRRSGRYLPRVCKPSYAGAPHLPLLCLAEAAAGGGGGQERSMTSRRLLLSSPSHYPNVCGYWQCVYVCACVFTKGPCAIGPKQSQRPSTGRAFFWSRGQRIPHHHHQSRAQQQADPPCLWRSPAAGGSCPPPAPPWPAGVVAGAGGQSRLDCSLEEPQTVGLPSL